MPLGTLAQNKAKTHYEYLLYVPTKERKPGQKYPLLIYLHGSSQRGHDLNKLKAYGLPHLIDRGRDFDFIIASPQCPAGKLWSTDNWFESLYQELTAKYPVDTSRVYLTGISMGGGGTFDVAKDYPHRFAALVPLCAWNSDTTRLCSLRHVPIWTFHGTADEQVPFAETQSKVAALRQCRGNIRLTTLENEGHGIQWLYEQQGTYDIYEWMLRHRKP